MYFVLFIGVCELLGLLGLILPGVTRIQPGLTSLAAAALTLLTICATVYQLMAGQPGNASRTASISSVVRPYWATKWMSSPSNR